MKYIFIADKIFMIHTTVFKQKNYLVVAFIIFAYTGKKLNILIIWCRFYLHQVLLATQSILEYNYSKRYFNVKFCTGNGNASRCEEAERSSSPRLGSPRIQQQWNNCAASRLVRALHWASSATLTFAIPVVR